MKTWNDIKEWIENLPPEDRERTAIVYDTEHETVYPIQNTLTNEDYINNKDMGKKQPFITI